MAEKLETIRSTFEVDNLATAIDDEDLNEIGHKIVELYEQDLESRSEWEENNDRWMKLATQVIESKDTPWKNAANIKYPLLSTASLQFHARAYPAIINNGKITKCKITGKQSESKNTTAERISTHMNFQLMDQMDEWQEEMDRMMYILPITGLVYKKTYYSPLKGRNVSALRLARDVVINYHATDYERATKTERIYMDSNELYEYKATGFYRDVDIPAPKEKAHDGIEDELIGLEPVDRDEDAPYEILESHTWYDIDEDGYKEPVIITVDKDSETVLRISKRYEEKDVEINAVDDTIIKITGTEYFTPYKFLPNPESAIYALGFGSLLGPVNSAVNTLLNQLVDAGTLSNLQGGFLGKGVRIAGGALRFSPGEWKSVQTTGDDLRKGIFPMPIKDPSNVLFQLLGMLIESGERLSSVKDIMVGENPGQNQPFRTTAAVLEQGMKVFVGIYKRVYRSLTKELRKLYRLNSIYLDESEYLEVNGLDTSVSLVDYRSDDLSIIPGADPNVLSRELEIMKANSLLEKVASGLPLNLQEVTKRVLEAEQHQDIESLTNVPPPQPPAEQVNATMELLHKIEFDWASHRARIMEKEFAAFKDYSQAIKNLASADATTAGIDRDNIQTILNELQMQHNRLIQEVDREMEFINQKQAQEGVEASASQPQQPEAQ